MKRKTTDGNRAVYASVNELAGELQISRKSTYDGLNNGTIPHIRIGRRFLIPRSAIQEWLKTAGQRPAA